MSAFEFIWNASQDGRIGDHEERVEELEEKVQLLYEWVMHLRTRIEELENDRV